MAKHCQETMFPQQCFLVRPGLTPITCDGFNYMKNTSKGPSSETSKFYCLHRTSSVSSVNKLFIFLLKTKAKAFFEKQCLINLFTTLFQHSKIGTQHVHTALSVSPGWYHGFTGRIVLISCCSVAGKRVELAKRKKC